MAVRGEREVASWGTGRLEAFSDGVLAIAITLLVLEIRLPAHRPGHLAGALAHLWPSYVAYAVSFLIVGIMWAQHHGLFLLITRADQGLLFVNVLLLAGISFLRFPTLVIAEALREEQTRGDVSAAMLLAPLAAWASYAVWVGLALFFLRGVPTSAPARPGSTSGPGR